MEKRNTFSGKIGFVLAAAGSAVGLGNLWRFPYLAAKYGGGIFLLVYLILAVTFGFVLMVTEIAIGRKTRLSPLAAFGALSSKWNWLGKLATFVPVLIFPYYCLIGGWVTKYTAAMLTESAAAAADSYFGSYVSATGEPLVWFAVFLAITMLVVVFGVNKGIEKLSKVLMPLLLIITVALSVYIVSRPGSAPGVRYYLMPDFGNLSFKTVLAALGQLFYSMSLAMGIMITYGSYLSKEEKIEKSARQIEIFDTVIALLAGLMIIPAVFEFSGGDKEALSSGPSLMFETLPKVFNSMPAGKTVGTLFFFLVLFAALTSSVSILEAIVSGLIDSFKMKRLTATALVSAYGLALGTVCSLGFGIWSDFTIIGMSILDFLDFVSNSIFLPLVGMLTCVLVGFVIKPDAVISEVELNGPFRMKHFYIAMVRWIAPVLIFAILVSGILQSLGILKI
ncbi:MAG: sodium-dependent transporter [Clostridia bacterium]|nr:sodium-dependent transporter [Clostridia bacterium]